MDSGDTFAPALGGHVRQRKIIHVDMDACFASCEQRDNPSLRGLPVAVGGQGARSVVAAASYEARAFGVHSAMPVYKALQLCPNLQLTPPRFDAYRAVSAQIREIFAEYTPLIEPVSLDEAYLDVTDRPEYATRLAKEIRAKIFERTELTASAGVSYNKFLAKMASDQRKPNGMFVITPDMGADFVASLPIGKFHGIGPATANRMEQLGIRNGLDLRGQSLPFLQQHFGKAGGYFFAISRGEDQRPVCADRVRKSIGAENTFVHDLIDLDNLTMALRPIGEKVWRHCERTGVRGRTVTVKIKFKDFEQITRSHSEIHDIERHDVLQAAAVSLLASAAPFRQAVRLLGVSLSNLNTEPRVGDKQMTFDL